ncbi:putative oxidoreductase [Cardiosporidium cionae]|uniref:Oxidoreductase n=1 Tax=Cardiosporidium cionae TaxID=476202 RepID=A0ABQ7JCU5_9APIC|nr:putative oxidoreductase [Cardiosporidium cionae]|eukprot:KAF8821810.1 putative oxidoreductase [Cardiosporidium cionae]
MGYLRRVFQPFVDVGAVRWIALSSIILFAKWSYTISLFALCAMLGAYFLIYARSIAYRLPYKFSPGEHSVECGGYAVNGKHVLVTGASAGLGTCMSRLSIYRGARRVTLMARQEAPLEVVQKQLLEAAQKESCNVSIQIVTVDIQNPTDVERAFRCARDGKGSLVATGDAEKDTALPIDFLVCNAGVAYPLEFENLSDSQIHTMIHTNLCGTIYCIRQVVAEMKERRSGAILLVSSEAALCPVYGFSVYSATKVAMQALATSLDQELRFFNIFVASVLPPTMKTPGLTAEKKIMPKITLEIEATTTLVDPILVGSHIFESMRRGRRFISFGYIGYSLAMFAGGFAPVNNYYDFLIQVCGSGILRLVALFLSSSWFKIIQSNLENKALTQDEKK